MDGAGGGNPRRDTIFLGRDRDRNQHYFGDMAFRSLSATGVQSDDSFIPLLKKTPYSPVLDQRLVYRVFVHRPIILDSLHHRIVLCDENEKYGFVTIELGKSRVDGTVKPRCAQYHGKEKDLAFKGTVEATMRELADIAMNILREMGDYYLLGNNCQNFCNKFLSRVDLKEGEYMTTAEQVGVSLAIGAGVAVLGGLAYALFGGTRKKDTKD